MEGDPTNLCYYSQRLVPIRTRCRKSKTSVPEEAVGPGNANKSPGGQQLMEVVRRGGQRLRLSNREKWKKTQKTATSDKRSSSDESNSPSESYSSHSRSRRRSLNESSRTKINRRKHSSCKQQHELELQLPKLNLYVKVEKVPQPKFFSLKIGRIVKKKRKTSGQSLTEKALEQDKAQSVPVSPERTEQLTTSTTGGNTSRFRSFHSPGRHS